MDPWRCFRDNVLFLEDGTLNGLLDYFHAGSDPFVMDLAIAINDWCGSMAGGKGEQQSEDSLLQGYQDIQLSRPRSCAHCLSHELLRRAITLFEVKHEKMNKGDLEKTPRNMRHYSIG